MKTLLDNQTILIENTGISLQFLRNYPRYKKSVKNKTSFHVNVLYNSLRDQVILSIDKLVNKKETYSVSKLRTEFFNHISSDNPSLKELKTKIKAINLLYDQLEINYIRKKHVAHLDKDRISKSINWDEVNNLLVLISHSHNIINKELYNTRTLWFSNIKQLDPIYRTDIISRNIRHKVLDLKRENKTTMNLIDVTEILKSPW